MYFEKRGHQHIIKVAKIPIKCVVQKCRYSRFLKKLKVSKNNEPFLINLEFLVYIK